MRKDSVRRTYRARTCLVAGLLLALGGCGLSEVDIPDFEGPAELALSLRLTATPDVVTADGFTTSLIQATVRNQDGQPVAGRSIVFSLADENGRFADIGQLSDPLTGERLHAGTAIARTAGNGVATVIYTTPARTDATANQIVRVLARPVGDDANGQLYRAVSIELRSAEPRIFPENPNNALPLCSFIMQPATGPYRVGQVISFQSTSRDVPESGSGRVGTIIRYEWFFGDGTTGDGPEEAKVYSFPGSFTVTHICTDDDGAQGAPATATVTVN